MKQKTVILQWRQHGEPLESNVNLLLDAGWKVVSVKVTSAPSPNANAVFSYILTTAVYVLEK